jgi:hypothetical protein
MGNSVSHCEEAAVEAPVEVEVVVSLIATSY